MKVYQSVLPAASRRECEAESTRDFRIARKLKSQLSQIFRDGFWYCNSCESRCERIEDENGQPAHCDKCGSPRIDWNRPTWLGEPLGLAPEQEAA